MGRILMKRALPQSTSFDLEHYNTIITAVGEYNLLWFLLEIALELTNFLQTFHSRLRFYP